MCFGGGQPQTVVQQVPVRMPARDPNAGLSQLARLTVLRARGVRDTVATSPSGDPNYGAGVRKPTLLGQTSS
jgi:hypothetical protein